MAVVISRPRSHVVGERAITGDSRESDEAREGTGRQARHSGVHGHLGRATNPEPLSRATAPRAPCCADRIIEIARWRRVNERRAHGPAGFLAAFVGTRVVVAPEVRVHRPAKRDRDYWSRLRNRGML